MVEMAATEEIYGKLRAYLDGLPGGYPSTESGKDIECLRWMFTPEEAEVEIHMRMAPEPASAIAKRCGKSESETKKILDAMVRDGLIFPVKSGKDTLYMAMQYMTGFSENQMSHRMNPETARLGIEYSEESGFLADFASQKQMRVVPVREAVEVTPAVATYMGMVARVAGERGLPMGKYEKLMNKSTLSSSMKQFKFLHKVHLGEPILNQMAKRGMV